MRWRVRLSEFTFNVQYKPGASHHAPDFLSRADNTAGTEPIDDDIPCLALAETADSLVEGRYTGPDASKPVEYNDIIEAQQSDDFCRSISERIAKKLPTSFFVHPSAGLLRKSPYGEQLVVPTALRKRILALEHQSPLAGHPGTNRMYYAMRRKYYWPSMITDIHGTVTMSPGSAQNSLARRRHATPLTLFPATEPSTQLSVDILGPLIQSKAGNKFVLVITDRFSKLTKCVALCKITAIGVVSPILEAWAACYGPPDTILSDQGPQFMSKFFIAVVKMLGTETVRTTAYHPRTNGQLERYNRTIATQLRHYVADDPAHWDELLPVLTMAYNSQPHRSTGIALFELVIPRRIPNLQVKNLPPGTSVKHGGLKDGSALSRKREFMAHLRKRIPDVVEALRKTQQRYKRNFDAGVSPRNARLRVGDYVYTKQYTRERKLRIRAVGPFVILDGDDSTYFIDVDGEEVRVNSDHVTPAPRPAGADNTPPPLLDKLDNPRTQPEDEDEYFVEKIVGIRKEDGEYQANVR